MSEMPRIWWSPSTGEYYEENISSSYVSSRLFTMARVDSLPDDAVELTVAAGLEEAIASCPGRELEPNPCRCPCYGCKHHCSAHDPEAEKVVAEVTRLCPAGDGAADEKLSPENLIDLLDTAWCVIANAGAGATHDGTVGWHNETAEWKEAAERLRDRWHEVLRLRCASRDEIER